MLIFLENFTCVLNEWTLTHFEQRFFGKIIRCSTLRPVMVFLRSIKERKISKRKSSVYQFLFRKTDVLQASILQA